MTEQVGQQDELRPVTSLFADVVGSTSLGERLAIDEVKAIIGECVSRMCRAVEHLGGEIGAYMGDGIAAFFGIQHTREDDAERALRAAIEIRDLMSTYSSEVREAWGVENFSVRVGLNAGRVAVGRVGAGSPQVLALGDAVNVAARLQSAAPPGGILVGRSVADRLRHRFDLRSVGPVPVRGRAERVEAFEYHDARSVDASRPRAPLIGRADELASLARVVSEVTDGRGQICFVVGEAGSGKTRLLEEVRQRLPSDVVWLEGRCDPLERRPSAGPFVGILRSWLGLDDDAAPIAARTRLRARLTALVGDRYEDLAPALGRLLGIKTDTSEADALDGLPPDVQRQVLHRAYRDWLVSLARATAVVCVLDGYERSDPMTRDIADEVLDATELAPVLFLVTMREDAPRDARGLRVRALTDLAPRYAEVRLQPMQPTEAASLVAALDPHGGLGPTLTNQLVLRAEGNPMYIEELVRSIASGDVNDEPALPAPLESVLLARIASLDAEPKALLEAAATLGRVFEADVLARMCRTDLDHGLAVILRKDLIREHRRDPVRYTFKHGLLREAVLSTLTPAHARELHARAADAVRSVERFDPSQDGGRLARHHIMAGDAAAAVETVGALVDELVGVYRYDEASELLETCRDALRDGADRVGYERATRRLADIAAKRGEAAAAIVLLDELIDLRPSDPALLLERATRLAEIGQLDEAEIVIASSLDRAGPLRTRFLLLRGQIALRQQSFDRLADALDAIGDVGDLDGDELDASSLWAGYLATQGEFEEAERWAERARALAAGTGVAVSVLRASRHVALVRTLRGRTNEGFDLLREVYERYGDLGYAIGQAEAGLNLIHVAHLVGAIDEGVRVGEELLSVAPSPTWEGMLAANLAHLYLEQDELDLAETTARRALAAERFASWPSTSARIVLALIDLARGSTTAAAVMLDEAETLASRAGREGERLQIRSTRASIALHDGDIDRALELTSLDPGKVERAAVVCFDRVRGTVQVAAGSDDGERLLRRTVEEAARCGLRLEEGRAALALGRLGDAEALAHARAIFVGTGCRRGLAETASASIPAVASDG